MLRSGRRADGNAGMDPTVLSDPGSVVHDQSARMSDRQPRAEDVWRDRIPEPQCDASEPPVQDVIERAEERGSAAVPPELDSTEEAFESPDIVREVLRPPGADIQGDTVGLELEPVVLLRFDHRYDLPCRSDNGIERFEARWYRSNRRENFLPIGCTVSVPPVQGSKPAPKSSEPVTVTISLKKIASGADKPYVAI